jgi:hypothetical protein
MPDTHTDNETLDADLQFLLECEFESKTFDEVLRNKSYLDTYSDDSNYVTGPLSVLIISEYHEPINVYDWQYLVVRYISPDGERGFGELCWSGDQQMSIMAMPVEAITPRLTDHGRDRVHFIAEGLRSGELVSEND